MRERNEHSETKLEEHSEWKLFDVKLFSQKHEPPMFEAQIRARTIEEATSRALVQGRNFNQAAIVNRLNELSLGVIKSIEETGSISKEEYDKFMQANPTHEDFEIDGIIVTNAKKVNSNVMTEQQMSNDIHDGFVALLSQQAKTEEE